MGFPSFPNLRDKYQSDGKLAAFQWFTQTLPKWISQQMNTDSDVTLNKAGKGVVLKNTDGTVTKRVRLNDAGDGLVIEDG